MFHNALVIMTMISVILHASLGCCVHHAHAVPRTDETDKIVAEACCHHHHVSHASSDRKLRDAGSPVFQPGRENDFPEPCDRGDCGFISLKRNDSFNRPCMRLTLLPALDQVDLSPSGGPSAHRTTTCHADDRLLLSEPVRSFQQVWLI